MKVFLNVPLQFIEELFLSLRQVALLRITLVYPNQSKFVYSLIDPVSVTLSSHGADG